MSRFPHIHSSARSIGLSHPYTRRRPMPFSKPQSLPESLKCKLRERPRCPLNQLESRLNAG